MCIAPHRTGEYGCCVFCIVFIFTFCNSFFSRLQMAPYLTRRAFKSLPWRSCCCFCFCLHASFMRRLTGAVVFCRVLLVQWNVNVTHLCVCVCLHCTDMHPGTMRILPRLGVGATSCPRWSAALYTSNWKNELFCFFLRQDVHLYYILHLSSCDTCIFILTVILTCTLASILNSCVLL